MKSTNERGMMHTSQAPLAKGAKKPSVDNQTSSFGDKLMPNLKTSADRPMTDLRTSKNRLRTPSLDRQMPDLSTSGDRQMPDLGTPGDRRTPPLVDRQMPDLRTSRDRLAAPSQDRQMPVLGTSGDRQTKHLVGMQMPVLATSGGDKTPPLVDRQMPVLRASGNSQCMVTEGKQTPPSMNEQNGFSWHKPSEERRPSSPCAEKPPLQSDDRQISPIGDKKSLHFEDRQNRQTLRGQYPFYSEDSRPSLCEDTPQPLHSVGRQALNSLGDKLQSERLKLSDNRNNEIEDDKSNLTKSTDRDTEDVSSSTQGRSRKRYCSRR
jgi:hypothetical protein